MTSIDYVVRDGAGALQRGVVSAEAPVTTITAASGQEISLNLRQVDMRGHQRDGDNLVIELADGRIIIIEGYFNDSGVANRLFVSADGYLNEVAFVETADGALYAQYGPTEQWGKWSPSDDLIYLGRTEVAQVAAANDDVSMLGAGLLGGATGLWGAGAAGAAVLGGTLLDDGNGGGPAAPADPYVDNADNTTNIGGDGSDPHSLTITGGGEPGSAVTVTVGDKTQEAVINDDGTFEVTFQGDDFPEDGTYETVVVVKDPAGKETELDGPGYVIDTTPPEIEMTSGTESVGDSFNAAGFANGVTLAGTGEAGATVEVTIEGITRTTTVGEDGAWSVTWQNGVLPEGEYTTGVKIVTTDGFGNSFTTTDSIVVDTVANVSVATTSVEGEGVVNAAEHSDGVTLTGSAQPGSSVLVTFGSGTREVVAGQDGAWTAMFTAAEIPTGEYEATVTAVATDAAGNSSTATGTVNIDTLVNPFTMESAPGGADGVINAAEVSSGIILTGKVEPGSAVTVQMGNATTQAVVSADGSWTATFSSSDIPAGEYTTTMTATATDPAGNTSTLTQSVTVDTVANALSINHPIEGDDIINGAEASDGVVLSGVSVPGAVVQIAMNGVTHSAVANSAGQWQAYFSAAEIPQGTYTADITATSTDAAGNTNTITDSVKVDTAVDNLSVAADIVEGDNVISGAEQADGVVVTGTTEPGSTVQVTIGNATVNAIVDANGNWVAQFAAAQIPAGEYETNVSVTATDVAGNVATVTDTVKVDTLVNTLNFNTSSLSTTVEGDGIVNAIEALDGINLGGQVEAGSTVVVNFNGINHTAQVDAAGNWSITIPPSAIAPGSYDADIVVTATDAVGNIDTIEQTIAVDTEAPDGPVVASYTRDTDGIRSIATEGNNSDIDIAQVNADGSISDVGTSDTYISAFGETLHAFNADVPDGSHLIVTDSDAAGNASSTYLVLDDESSASSVALGNPGLGNYQIEAVDLQFAEEATLSLTEAQIISASDTSDTLTVHGGSDDTVQITGATLTGTTNVDGQTYNVYSVGSDATLVVDADITVEEPPVI